MSHHTRSSSQEPGKAASCWAPPLLAASGLLWPGTVGGPRCAAVIVLAAAAHRPDVVFALIAHLCALFGRGATA